MFSGIVECTGRIVAIEQGPDPLPDRDDDRVSDHHPVGSIGLTIDVSGLVGEQAQQDFPMHGASICVSGCCLTAARLDPERSLIGFDVIAETLSRTSLGGLKVGQRVNLEQSVQPTTRLDGHVVQGHVEGLGEVLSIETRGEWRVRIRPPADLMPAIIPKGSIAVEGVSLTLAAVDPAAGWFEIALIPTTLDLTTLGELQPGARVNLETDILARTAVHWLTHFGPSAIG